MTQHYFVLLDNCQETDMNSSTSEHIKPSLNMKQCPDLDDISRSTIFVPSLILNSVANLILLFGALFGNLLILWVIRGVSSIHPPSRTMFCSLAASDLCVGLLVEPFNLMYMITSATGNAVLCSSVLPYLDVIGFTLSGISLLTTAEISVDRLLALRLRIRYREVVSLYRARVVVAVTWLTCCIAGTSSVWSRKTFMIMQIVGVFVSIMVSSYSYTSIHRILRQVSNRRQERTIAWDQASTSTVSTVSGSALSIRRYRKTVSTALWVYCALLICSFPYMIVAALWAVFGGNEAIIIAHSYMITLLYFNSALNPVLYCLKIKDVKQAVRETLCSLSCK